MRRNMKCLQCDEFIVLPFTDKGGFRVVCANGHSIAYLLQQAKFEQLATIAITALQDGYFREAVVSFNASLERFYEFYWFASGYEANFTDEALESAWKSVAKQSERQLGLYVAAYFRDNGIGPVLLPSAQQAFRNDVVHKGVIPTREQASGFIEAVLKVNYNLARSFAYTQAGMRAMQRDLATHADFAVKGDCCVTSVEGSIYSMSGPHPLNMTLKRWLSLHEKAGEPSASLAT